VVGRAGSGRVTRFDSSSCLVLLVWCFQHIYLGISPTCDVFRFSMSIFLHLPISVGVKKRLDLETPIIIVDCLCPLGQGHTVCKIGHLTLFFSNIYTLKHCLFFSPKLKLTDYWDHFVDKILSILKKKTLFISFCCFHAMNNTIYRLTFPDYCTHNGYYI